jgi:hemerythrin-like domain-containing protein
MLRYKSLVPLSRQHQHALALCVRIKRALQGPKADLAGWQEEIERIFEDEIRDHFEAEERILFPKAAEVPELKSLVAELLAEHGTLRDFFGKAAVGQLQASELGQFAQHIRKEEGQLFELSQRIFSAVQLGEIGTELATVLEESIARARKCALPKHNLR